MAFVNFIQRIKSLLGFTAKDYPTLYFGDGFVATSNVTQKQNEIQLDPAYIEALAGGDAANVATLALLRAVAAGVRADQQVRFVEASHLPYQFDLEYGAGVADNGLDIIKPNDVLLASAGRWRLAPALASATDPGLLQAKDYSRLRGGLGGTLHAKALAPSDVANLSNNVVIYDTITLVEGDRVLLPNQTNQVQNGLYVLGVVSGGFAPLTRAPEFNDSTSVAHGSTITVRLGDLTTGVYNSGSEWRLETTGTITVDTTELSFSRLPDSRDRLRLDVLFDFDGVPVTPGSNKGAEINTWLDAGFNVVLAVGGLYQVEVPIVLPSGRSITCPTGIATIVAAYAPNVSQADVATNALLLVQGALDTATLNTTLTNAIAPGGVNYYGAGARKFSLASVGTLAPGGWLTTNGHETGIGENPGGSNGTNIECQEMMQCSSISALKVTPKWPTQQHHVTTNGGVGLALSVKGVVPNINARIEGIRFDASGGTIANGILLDYCAGTTIERCEFIGFSRAAIEARLGSRDLNMNNVIVDGECNGGIHLSSTFNVQISDFRTSATGARKHANGTYRAAFEIANVAINTTLANFQIRHVMKGMRLGSFHVANISNGVIDDVDIRDLMTQNSEETVGIGIDMGYIDLGYANYSGPLSLSDVTITNCRADPAVAWPGGSPADVLTSTVWFHDVYGINASSMVVENQGLSPYTTLDGDDDYWMPGVAAQDCYGQVVGLRVRGCEHGFIVNSGLGFRVSRSEFLTAPGGGGTNPVVGLWYQARGIGQVLLEDCRIEGGVYFATSAVYDTSSLRLKNIVWDTDVWTGELMLAKNTTGGSRTWGQAGTFDPTAAAGVPEVDLPAATRADRVCIWAMPQLNTVANNAYGFVLIDGTGVVDCAAGAIAVGDKLVAQSASAIAAVSSTSPFFFATATRTKGAGAGKVTAEIGFASTADAAATANAALQRGSSGEAVAAWFAPAGTVSTTGLLRNPNNTTIASARLNAGTTVNVLSTTSGDNLNIGGTWAVTLLQGALLQLQSTSGGSGFILDSSKFNYYQPIWVDSIEEHTAANGVLIDGVLLKDIGVKADTIVEKTATAGVLLHGEKHHAQVTVGTTGTTTTTLATIAIADDTTVQLDAAVTSRLTSVSIGASSRFVRGVCVKRVSGGVATIVGASFTIGTDQADAGAAGLTVAWDVDGGNNARLRVTGLAATNVTWNGWPISTVTP